MFYKAMTRLVGTLFRARLELGGDEALRQRMCLDGPIREARFWIHGASVGELTSARQIIEGLQRSDSVLVTSNTETARAMVESWGIDARLAPLDIAGALDRFLDQVRPKAQITVEGEYWPLRSAELARRGTPQAMIGARMSQRSAARWARLPNLIRPMLERLSLLSAQDADSEARLIDLGAREGALLPVQQLKLLGPAEVTPPDNSALRDRTVLAASTHEGEEAVVLDAFLALRRTGPESRLILAIRHPQRGNEVAALIAARGLPFARRSLGEDSADIILVDTLGEMGRWYDLAGICLVGGSLTDRGGHTPWEPAAHRCAILHGPHVQNAAESYADLDRAGAAQQVSAESLPRVLIDLVGDPDRAHLMGQTARDILTERAGDPGELIDRLRDLAQMPR